MPSFPSFQRQDNRFKWAIRDAILTELFKPVEEAIDEQMLDLIKRNARLQNYAHLSFAYNGKFYTFEETQGPPVRQRLHDSLLAETQALIAEKEQVLYERLIANSYLTSVLAVSNAPGDYLSLLPGALHGAVKRVITCLDWSPSLSAEKIAAFKAKYQQGYELLRQRMAFNLIL